MPRILAIGIYRVFITAIAVRHETGEVAGYVGRMRVTTRSEGGSAIDVAYLDSIRHANGASFDSELSACDYVEQLALARYDACSPAPSVCARQPEV
ncbi:TPA: hypothetical protein QDC51_001368 [Burkholderia multivorans]|uniref:hypothetical protein n=1 Tax=Burkholderia multivorans TaxID=87883 RepID=UPI001C2378A4|nr:hypothetical protein [Burkholderia multivorans]MBU9353572.1 hypothetical protein [Burkholderia multivorans]MBU9396883.1 hypothetical protein [Burkholderia multivorans]MBU9606356.1 hypothetical protein [Burkholderia multivorans]MBU9624422.1 hypothetical protein [Burkholderia multivorans]HDR9834607.1 hypothetical protein [Burkholderia multivorans]